MVSNLNLMESRRRILLNTPHLESLSGSTLSFKTDMASKLKECKIHFTPIQEGSGDPSPDNVRPIHGWDGVTVYRAGKNLVANGIYCGRLRESNRKYIGSVYYCHYFPIPKSMIYISKNTKDICYVTVSNEPPTTGVDVIPNTGIPTMTNVLHYTYDNSVIGAKYMCIHCTNNAEFQDLDTLLETSGLMITTDEYQDYEPETKITSTEITIPFPQTIYGGYVDLVKGEVVEEYGAFEFTGDENIKYTTNWNAKGNYYVNASGVLPFCSQSDVNNIYCNILKPRSSSYFDVNEGMVSTHGADTDVKRAYRYIIIGKDGFGETINECKAKLKELYDVGTPLTVVSKYAKAFVKTHPLTPQTIKTLRGINNIWSDANGNIELKFWTH